MSLFPCPYCKERLEADVFANHLKHCGPHRREVVTEQHVNCSECRCRPAIRGDDKGLCVECREVTDRGAAQSERMEAEGDFGAAALTAWEKRLLREGKTFVKKGRR